MSEQQHEPEGVSRRRTEKMPTFAPLFRLKFYVHSVGNFKLWREVTVTQLIGSVVGALVVYRISGLIFGGQLAMALAAAAAIFIPRGIAIAEDAGRPPLVEVRAWIKHLFASHYYNGARPAKGAEATRLKAMLEEERAMGNVRRKKVSSVLVENLKATFIAVLGSIPKPGGNRGFDKGSMVRPKGFSDDGTPSGLDTTLTEDSASERLRSASEIQKV